jgi:integrase
MAKRSLPKLAIGRVKAHARRGPREDGAFYWQAVVYEGGAQRTVWTGWGHAADVERACGAYLHTGETEAAKQAQRTVKGLLERWIAYQDARENYADSSKINDRQAAKHLTRLVGDVLIDRVSTETADTFIQAMLREKAASGSVKLHVGALVRAWRWGVERGICPDRTLRLPRFKVKPTREKRTPTAAEVRQVLAALQDDGWQRTAFLVLAGTGARLQEGARLEWSDVDLAAGLAYIRDGEGRKTGRREVPLAESLARHLRAVPEADRVGRVVRTSVKNVVSTLCQKWIRAACEKGEVPRFTNHGLRRFYENALIRNNVPITVVARIMGHSPQMALASYADVTREDMQAAVKTAAAALDLGPTLRAVK